MPLPPAAALWLALAQDPANSLAPWAPRADPDAPPQRAPASAPATPPHTAPPAPSSSAATPPSTPADPPAPSAPAATPPAAPARAADPAALDAYRRLVFVNLYGLTFGLPFPIPSGDFSFFLGSTLRPRASLRGRFLWRTALGYQATLSVGWADLITLAVAEGPPRGPADESILFAPPIFYHRHHVTAHGFGGPRGRFYYAMGGGLWLVASALAGLEAEGRLGFRFGARAHHRVSGVVGGHLRLGGVVSAYRAYPVPTFGVFVGYMVF